MTYLAASLFFTLVLLGSTVMFHMIVLRNWDEIARALGGELGLRPAERQARRTVRPGRYRPAVS